MATDGPNLKYEMRQFGVLGSVGLHLVLGTAGLAIGYFLDRALETKPWLTPLFLLWGGGRIYQSVSVMRSAPEGIAWAATRSC